VIDRKRAFDLACCLIAAPVALPVGLLIAALVRATSGRPVFYRGRRMGRGGREFEILKFRTMISAQGAVGVTTADDGRITTLGRWLRRSKLDELPQLVNVLRDEMSIVGPRPEDPRFGQQYSGRYAAVLGVRPGITGPAAVQFRHEEELLQAAGATDVDAYYAAAVLPRKLDIDLAYVTHPTLRKDLSILLATARALPTPHPAATMTRSGRP
jgi:lipopolysaccharide/colanic/teichoic acid biosynthesis glycosyltransferase